MYRLTTFHTSSYNGSLFIAVKPRTEYKLFVFHDSWVAYLHNFQKTLHSLDVFLRWVVPQIYRPSANVASTADRLTLSR